MLAPDAERRLASQLVADGPIPEVPQALPAEHRQDDDHQHGGHREPERDRIARAAAIVAREQGGERERRELGGRRERQQHAPSTGSGKRSEGQHDQQRDERVVCVRAQHEQRVGIGRPRVGEHHSRAISAAAGGDAAADPEERAHRRQVEEERGRMCRREVVPPSRPGKHLLEGHIGVVVDGAVRVARGVIRGKVAVERLAVGEPVGADHARVADVDHVRVRDVEPDAKAHEEDQCQREPADRHERAEGSP